MSCGFSMQEMILTGPAQCSHFSMSIPKTLFSRCAQPIVDARDAPLSVALGVRAARPGTILARNR